MGKNHFKNREVEKLSWWQLGRTGVLLQMDSYKVIMERKGGSD